MLEKLIANEEEPPEGLDAEKDVYVPMPRQREVLRDVKVVNRLPRVPRIVLPGGLPAD